MTNEQLAVLLDSYSGRLKTILDDIESGLPDGMTRADEWWDGEQKLSAEKRIIASLHWGVSQGELESQGCELRPTGDAFILYGLRRFISGLKETVSLLSSDKEAWKTA